MREDKRGTHDRPRPCDEFVLNTVRYPSLDRPGVPAGIKGLGASMTWIREGLADFTSITKGALLAPGRFGKAVKPLKERHGWEEVRLAWRQFLLVTEIQYSTPEYFARTYPQWVRKPKVEGPPPRFREVMDGRRVRLIPDDAA